MYRMVGIINLLREVVGGRPLPLGCGGPRARPRFRRRFRQVSSIVRRGLTKPRGGRPTTRDPGQDLQSLPLYLSPCIFVAGIRQIRAPRGRARRTKRSWRRNVLGDPFWDPPWISGRRQNRQIGQSESIRLAPLFCLPHPPPHLRSKRATNNYSMTYERVQHVRSYAWHI